MNKTLAFKGLRYNSAKVGDIEEVIAPPYDVISSDHQDILYSRNPKNIIRLILGKEYPLDCEGNNRYSRSQKSFEEWIADGTLVEEKSPSIYLCAHRFKLGGQEEERIGVIVRRKLERFGEGSIHPHERTLAGPKIDRLKLTRSCKANFSQVFGLYHDSNLTIDDIWRSYMQNNEADITVNESSGESSRIWVISDKAILDKVLSFFEDIQIVIADGHHRYETALAYQEEQLATSTLSDDPSNYVMMFLANSAAAGFKVLPTHRVLLNSANGNYDNFVKKLEEYFTVEQVAISKDDISELEDRLLAKKDAKLPSIGLILSEDSGMLLNFINKDSYLKLVEDLPEPEELKLLDVSILQNLIFEQMLNITKEQVANKVDVKFTVDSKHAKKLVDSGAATATFLLNSIDIEKVYEVAKSGYTMPQKSTYFYPKLLSGLVINKLC
ncbi:MAG: DUF1015 domain-containing protein [Nitrospinota bacterium]